MQQPETPIAPKTITTGISEAKESPIPLPQPKKVKKKHRGK